MEATQRRHGLIAIGALVIAVVALILGPVMASTISGKKGDAGPMGLQGLQGPPGTNGSRGDQGPRGPQGLQGLNGSQGPAGLNGAQGPAGPMGPEGPRGVPGAGGFPLAYVWGEATITDVVRDRFFTNVTFVIDYVNFGNMTASNVVVTCTFYFHPRSYVGSQNVTTQVILGDVPSYTADHFATAYTAGLYDYEFITLRVTFTWS